MEHKFTWIGRAIPLKHVIKIDQSVRYLKQAQLELAQLEGQRDSIRAIECMITVLNEERYS